MMYRTAYQSRMSARMFRALAKMESDQATKVVSALIDSGKTFDGEDPHDIWKYLYACEEKDQGLDYDRAKMFQHLSRDKRVAVLNVPYTLGVSEWHNQDHTEVMNTLTVATLLMQAPEIVLELVFNDETLVRPKDVVKALMEKDFGIAGLYDMIAALLDYEKNAGPLLTGMMEHWPDGEEVVAEAIQDFGTEELCPLLKSLPPNQRIQLYGQMNPEKVAEVLAAGVEDESTHVESTHVSKKPRHR